MKNGYLCLKSGFRTCIDFTRVRFGSSFRKKLKAAVDCVVYRNEKIGCKRLERFGYIILSEDLSRLLTKKACSQLANRLFIIENTVIFREL